MKNPPKLIFIDMDGVVSDFDKHFLDIYHKPMEEMTRNEQNRFWDIECVSFRFFANSPLIPQGADLVKQLDCQGFKISFLTSTGGQTHHVDIAKQKLDFLQRYGLGYFPIAFATGTESKAAFSKQDCILIDDRKKVVDAFNQQEGTAFLFKRNNTHEIINSVIAL